MPIAAPPPPTRPPVWPPTAIGPERADHPEEDPPNCTAAWAMVAILCAFKIVTIGIILLAARQQTYLIPMLVAMNWPWLIVLGLLLSAIPFGFWLRLLRARSRRRRLQYSEWNVESVPPSLAVEQTVREQDPARWLC